MGVAITGALFYKETITFQQMVGIGLCIVGLIVMNRS